MCSHGLWQLVESKWIVQTCYQKASCKLFQQVVTSLQVTSSNKPDLAGLLQLDEIDELVATQTNPTLTLPNPNPNR